LRVPRLQALLCGISACALALAVAACSGGASHPSSPSGRPNIYQLSNAAALAEYVNTWYAESLSQELTGQPDPSADIPASARQQALSKMLGYARRVALPCRGAKLSVIAGTPIMVEFWTARCKMGTQARGPAQPGTPTPKVSLPPVLVAAPAQGCVLPQADSGSIATFLADFARSGPHLQPDPVASADRAKPGTWYLGPCAR
jgi:hypothetical protein